MFAPLSPLPAPCTPRNTPQPAEPESRGMLARAWIVKSTPGRAVPVTSGPALIAVVLPVITAVSSFAYFTRPASRALTCPSLTCFERTAFRAMSFEPIFSAAHAPAPPSAMNSAR